MKPIFRWALTLVCIVTVSAVALAQTFNPPIPTIVINGHTYTNGHWQANFWGTAAAIANDIGLVTAAYPSGKFSPRVKLTADLTMYVGGAGASDTNNCLINFPCATVQQPFDVLRDGYDLAGFVVTVQVANGTYSPGLKLRGRFVGQQSPASIVLQGNPGTPGSVIIQDLTVPTNAFQNGQGTAILAAFGGEMTVNGIRVQAGYRCLWATDGSSEIRFLNIDFGSCVNAQQAATRSGVVRTRGNATVSAPSLVHYRAQDGGVLYASDPESPEITPVITITGNPAFGNFARIVRGGILIVNASQTTFVGAATGSKFGIDTLGLIDTSGSGVNYLPGSLPGAASTGAIYN